MNRIYVPRRRRIYRGNVPADGSTLLDAHGEWALYQRPPRCAEFLGLKLISKLPRVGAANIHLTWHVAERRLTRSNSARALARDFPELYQWVVQTAQHYFADERAAVG